MSQVSQIEVLRGLGGDGERSTGGVLMSPSLRAAADGSLALDPDSMHFERCVASSASPLAAVLVALST